MPLVHRFLDEAFRHGKPIAVAPDGLSILEALAIPEGEGVSIADAGSLAGKLLASLAMHRFPRRVSNLEPN